MENKKHKGCKFCSKSFKDANNLEIHERIHNNVKPFKCFCGKSFSQVTNLNNHARIHTGERPFCCHICPQRFRQVTTLNQHLRVHLDIRPFKCLKCDDSFHQRSNLQEHLLNQHGEQEKMTKVDHRPGPRSKKKGQEMISGGSDKFTEKKVPISTKEKAESIKSNDSSTVKFHNGKRLRFTPVDWWFQCQVCKVCIHDEEKFMLHKTTKHPPTTSSEESDNDDHDDKKGGEESTSTPALSQASKISELSSTSNSSSNKKRAIIEVEEIYMDGNENENESSAVPKNIKTDNEINSPVVPIENVSNNISNPTISQTVENVDDKSSSSSDVILISHTQTNNKGDVSPLCIDIDSDKDDGDEADKNDNNKTSNSNTFTPLQPQIKSENESQKESPQKTAQTQPNQSLESHQQQNEIEPEPSTTPPTTSTKYSCCICEKLFTYKANLNCHLSIAHLSKKKDSKGQLILRCGLCPSTFTVRKQLASHTWTHTDEYRFKCPSCADGFILKSKYQAHSKICRNLKLPEQSKLPE